MKKTLFILSLILLPFNGYADENVIDSGTWDNGNQGSGSWVINNEGVLIISGNGAMQDYDWTGAPWYANRGSITSVVLEGEKKDENGNVISIGITTIGARTFCNAGKLQSIIIPKSVTDIGAGAFSGYNKLQSITLPDGLTNIGNGAFHDAGSLTSIIIPNSVTSIGSYAFKDIQNLKKIIIGDNVTSIGKDAFLNIASEALIYCQNTPKHNCYDLVNDTTKGSDKLKIYTTTDDGKIVVGYKTYASLSDLASGKYIPKRIYTIDEANQVAKPTGNRVSITYR